MNQQETTQSIIKSKKELQELFKTDSLKNKKPFPKKPINTIRTMTFNVHNWKDYAGNKETIDPIFDIICDSNADIVGINEGMYFGKNIYKKVKEYVELLEYKYFLECNNRYGINLLLSKYPIVSHKVIHLGTDPIHKKNRYALKATINVNNTNVNILIAHLDVWDVTEETRLNQIKIIFEEIDSTYILMGDFNSLRRDDYTSKEWESFKADDKVRGITLQNKVIPYIEKNKFVDCFVKINKVCPKVSVWSMRRVDYIYVGEKFPHNIVNCDMFATIASDHWPIFMDISCDHFV